MKNYGVNELRKMFLEFFESKEHLKMNSFSLIPHNDNSLLLINSGMAPLKPYFTGQEIPPKKRVTTCQKCIRTGDIENVGKTARHGTFFEMLGNFSFGDYFKHEAIAWTWEFLTDVVGLDADRLYPSVYVDDDEAFHIWNQEIGIAPERIFKFGKADNFWEHGAGPCGPCSEVYYDRGEKYGCGKPDCTVGCDCDRYMEVWNNVFTQFDNDGKGNYEELEHKNIDTGMGLERLAVVVQDVDSIFDVDTIKAIRDKICDMAHVTYKENEKKDVSIRLITDHIRSVTFMTSDGILPSNEGRGYVLRRLLRRAARHGRLLGIEGSFLAKLSKTVIEVSHDAYPELLEKQEHIFATLNQEEENFNKTIDQGLSILNTFIADIKKSGKNELGGEHAFKLYDTYGFPLDLTKEILEEAGISVDGDGFDKAMQIQRETARKARKTTNYMGADATVYEQIPASVETNFVGYDKLTAESSIVAMTNEETVVDKLSEGESGAILVVDTPFYATMGGQCGDTGIIKTLNSTFVVKDTVKVVGGKTAHIGYVESGDFSLNETVTLVVDSEQRALTCKNHSATHLLQKALKIVLGGHVEQAGSYVSKDRLRFDFTHMQAMTKEEIEKVEAIVNAEIEKDLSVSTDVMSLEDAKKTGAMALFGEKYGDTVRVVSMGEFSRELCGGTHVPNTNVIGSFKIISEQGVAAGVRRIEALTSKGAMEYYAKLEEELLSAAAAAKTEPAKLAERITAMLAEIKALQAENQKLKDKMAKSSVGDAMADAVEVSGIKILPVKMKDVDMNALRNLGDDFKAKLGSSVIILASDMGDKVNLIVMATDDAVAKGAHAGNIIKEIAPMVGGGGGGRPNMAQAGGKNPQGIDDALAAGVDKVKAQL
ncbi:MAG: alanine--tRNA ligase [Clostridium sp.]|nr:alanine--tRNA ligase [Clostridium sp.]MCM1398857.1 alanine--tRNA ligase [Clostridium sp.]MCM1458512.1 alanine--tRNA ligase [Bacteroides sp.]